MRKVYRVTLIDLLTSDTEILSESNNPSNAILIYNMFVDKYKKNKDVKISYNETKILKEA